MNLLNYKLKNHIIYLVLCAISGILLAYRNLFGILFFLLLLYKLPHLRKILIIIFFIVYLEQICIKEWRVEPLEQIETAKVDEILKITDDYVSSVVVNKGIYIYMIDYNKTPIEPGDIITIKGELKIPNNVTIKHGFDFKSYLFSKNISFTLSPKTIEVIDHKFHVGTLRYNLKKEMDSNMPTLTAQYINALFLGDKNELNEEIQNNVTNLGVIHLFAISGLHVGLLSSLFLYVLKRLNFLIEIREMLLIFFLIIFMLLSGGSASVVRSSFMVILGILNKRLKLNFSLLDIFSVVFLCHCLINPFQVTQSGFIFSYLLTSFLLLNQNMLSQLNGVKLYFILPLIAQLASLPLQVYFYYQVNLLSYVANLILVPLFSCLLMPLLILVICFPMLSNYSEIFLRCFEWLIAYLSSFLTFNITFGSLNVFIVILLYVFIIIGCIRFERHHRVSVLFMLTICLMLTLEINRTVKPFSKITMLDVGQGDSFIIQSPFQTCKMIIDTGGKVSFSGDSKSQFRQTLNPYLLGEGIREIDFLILTHGDYDHIGEARALMEHFLINNLIVSPFKDTSLMDELIQYAKETNINVIRAKKGDILSCGNTVLTFYHPSSELTNVNDQSLVFKLDIGAFSSLFTGDISSRVESFLLPQMNDETFDMYKAAHHGSESSNSLLFLEQVNPSFVLVSAGRKNTYGHPSKAFIETLDELDIPLLNTQTVGSVEIIITPHNFTLQTFSPD